MVQLPTIAVVFTLCLLFTVVVTDILWRKVHNLVTIPFIVSGVIHHTVQSGVTGLLMSLAAVLTAVVLLIVPFLLGGLGAGDIKLLGGIGAWALVPDVIWVFGIAGLLFGVLALWQWRFCWKLPAACVGSDMLTDDQTRSWSRVTPFAVLLAVGVVVRFCMVYGMKETGTALEVQV